MTKQMRVFAVYYAESKDAKHSCLLAGYSESYAKSKSHLLLKNREVMEIVTELSKEHYKNMFEQLGLKSIKKLEGIIDDAENRATQLNAIKYVLGVTGVTDKDADTGVIEIKVKLPNGL